MKARFRLWSFVLLIELGMVASLGAIEVGDAWSSPPAELGSPSGVLEAGAKTLYRWPQVEILVEAGRVAQIRRLDPVAEAAAAVRRAQMVEAENERLAAEERLRAKAAEESEIRERAVRLESDRLAQDAKIQELERQNAAQATELAEVAKRREAERTARSDSLRKELSVLRLELGRAREAGDTEKANRLSAAIRTKAQEWRTLKADTAGL